MGILFTNRKEKNVWNWFNSFSVWDYPYPGYEVDVTIRLRKGPLPQFQPAIEPYLRKLGMPTNLVNGMVAKFRVNVYKLQFLLCIY